MVMQADYRAGRAIRMGVSFALAATVAVVLGTQIGVAESLLQRSTSPGMVIDAPPGDRSDEATARRWFVYDWVASNPASDALLRDQETLISTDSGEVANDKLITTHLNLNLPEGSELTAQLVGEQVRLQPSNDATRISIQDGTLLVFDREGHQRVSVRCREQEFPGTLHATARLENDEVTFQLSATGADGAERPLTVALDLASGIPQGEDDHPMEPDVISYTPPMKQAVGSS